MNAFNSSFWTNQQFLDLYNQLIATSNAQQRGQLSFQLQKVVRDDAPYVGRSTKSPFAWAVAPTTMGRSGYGLGLAGTF